MFDFLTLDEGLAVRHPNGSLSFRELRALLGVLATRLDPLGLSPGDRVAALLPNSLEFLASYYACMLRGLVIVPINERLTPPEVEAIFRHSGAVAAITSRNEEVRLGRFVDRVLPLEGIHEWPAGQGRTAESVQVPNWAPDHPAVLFYTSGSTGRPKGVLYTHRTLTGNCRVYGAGLEITAADRSVLCHCMSSNFVFAQLTVPFLAAGASVEIVDFGDVGQTLAAIEGGATFLSLIPWFGFRLIDEGRRRAMRPTRLRVTEVGGDRVPARFFTEFEDVFGIRPREHLGMAEANTFTVNPPGPEFRKGSVGRALPHVDLEIRDPSGTAVEPGVEGQIWVLSPANMEEYWNDRVATEATLVDGWVATGDAGVLDSDGYLWYVGRLKKIIICDGDNIHPGEVERVLEQHPAVDRACVVGLPHETRGETVAAAIVPTDPVRRVTASALADYLAPRLTSVKIPTDLLFVDRLPETPAGKIDRGRIVKEIQRRRHEQLPAAVERGG